MSQEPTERVEKLFQLFKRAVEQERKSQAMYREAIELCEDELSRTVLQDLHDDEVRHEQAIVERYNKLRRDYDLGE